MSSKSLTPRGLTEVQTPPNDGDVFIYNAALDKWVPGAFLPVDPTTTLGDLIVQNGSALDRLPVGTDGQLLTADSGADLGLAWTDPTLAAATDVALTSPADGEVLTYDGGTGKWVNGPALVGMQQIDVQIAHAAILTLPSTPVELIPPPGPGLGIQVFGAWVVSECSAGPYTNESTGGDSPFSGDPGCLYLTHGATDDQNVTNPARLIPLLATAFPFVALLSPVVWAGPDVPISPFSVVIDASTMVEGIYLFANNADGDLTGGDPANTLSVRVWYAIVPTAPFGS